MTKYYQEEVQSIFGVQKQLWDYVKGICPQLFPYSCLLQLKEGYHIFRILRCGLSGFTWSMKMVWNVPQDDPDGTEYVKVSIILSSLHSQLMSRRVTYEGDKGSTITMISLPSWVMQSRLLLQLHSLYPFLQSLAIHPQHVTVTRSSLRTLQCSKAGPPAGLKHSVSATKALSAGSHNLYCSSQMGKRGVET